MKMVKRNTDSILDQSTLKHKEEVIERLLKLLEFSRREVERLKAEHKEMLDMLKTFEAFVTSPIYSSHRKFAYYKLMKKIDGGDND